MNIERFTQLVRAYGADPALWPSGERDAANRLLQASADARRAAEQESRLDALMSRSRVSFESGDLLDRIVANATAQPQARARPVPARAARSWFAIDLGLGQLWQQASGLAACALLGFFVGYSGMVDVSPSDAGELEISAMVGDDAPFDGAGL